MEYSFSEVKIGSLETMCVASAQVISNHPEEEVINYLIDWLKRNDLDTTSRQFGFDIPVSQKQNEQGLRGYEYWAKVEGNTKVSEDVVLKRIEECEYAILRITNPFSNPFEVIPEGWKRLAHWVSENGYMKDCSEGNQERYWLEEKLEEDGITYLDLYFPIH